MECYSLRKKNGLSSIFGKVYPQADRWAEFDQKRNFR